MLLTFVGLESAGTPPTPPTAVGSRRFSLRRPCRPTSRALAVLAALVAVVAAALRASSPRRSRSRAKRRTAHGLAGRFIGGPLSAAALVESCCTELWNLIRGAAPLASPPAVELGRRYVELVCRESRPAGIPRAARGRARHGYAARSRLRAAGADASLAVLHAAGRRVGGTNGRSLRPRRRRPAITPSTRLPPALAMPMATEPHLVTFAPEGPWRGETHRVCDRPGSLARLLEEVAAAGAEQVILVTALPPQGRPHELSAERGDLRGHAADSLAAFETAGVRDALEHWSGRFLGFFVIRPAAQSSWPARFRRASTTSDPTASTRSRSSSIAATRTPTGSSSSRSSRRAAISSRQSNAEFGASLQLSAISCQLSAADRLLSP